MNPVFVAAIFSSFLCKQVLSDYHSKIVNKTSPNPVCRFCVKKKSLFCMIFKEQFSISHHVPH